MMRSAFALLACFAVAPFALAQSATDQLLAVSASVNEVRVVSPSTGETLRRFGQGFFSGARSVAVIPGTRTCVVGSEADQKLIVFNFDTGAKVQEFRVAFAPRAVLPLTDLSQVVWFQSANAGASYSFLTQRAHTLFHGPSGRTVAGTCRFRALVYGVTNEGSIMNWMTAGGEPLYESSTLTGATAASQPVNAVDGYAYSLLKVNDTLTLRRFKVTDRPTWDASYTVTLTGWTDAEGLTVLSNGTLAFIVRKPNKTGIGIVTLKTKQFKATESANLVADSFASFVPKAP
jgi:hypothetical protein